MTVTSRGHFVIEWLDGEREPREKPDPRFPAGVDIDMTAGSWPHCVVPLPYPAKRCGQYVVECQTCGLRVVLTTAGRPDDPRSLKVRCQPPKGPLQ